MPRIQKKALQRWVRTKTSFRRGGPSIVAAVGLAINSTPSRRKTAKAVRRSAWSLVAARGLRAPSCNNSRRAAVVERHALPRMPKAYRYLQHDAHHTEPSCARRAQASGADHSVHTNARTHTHTHAGMKSPTANTELRALGKGKRTRPSPTCWRWRKSAASVPETVFGSAAHSASPVETRWTCQLARETPAQTRSGTGAVGA